MGVRDDRGVCGRGGTATVRLEVDVSLRRDARAGRVGNMDYLTVVAALVFIEAFKIGRRQTVDEPGHSLAGGGMDRRDATLPKLGKADEAELVISQLRGR